MLLLSLSPSRLTSAPWILTLLKPVFSHLQLLGFMVIGYIDDCTLFAAAQEERISYGCYALYLFDSVGLTITVQNQFLCLLKSWFLLGNL